MGKYTKDVRKTNETNMAINQANLDNARQMQQNEFDYNTQMFHMTNAYNDPSAQAQRFRNAGLNPAMMLYGGNTNEATAQSGSAGSSPSMIPMQSPDAARQRSKQDALAALNQMESSFNNVSERNERNASAELMDAQAKSINIDNNYKAQRLLGDIAKVWSEAGRNKSQKEGQDIQNSIQRQSHDALVEYNKQQLQLQAAQTYKYWVDSMVAQEMLPYMQQDKVADISQKLANVSATYQQINESKAREHYLDKQVDEIVANLKLTAYSDEQIEQIKQAFVKRVQAEANKAGMNQGADNPWQAISNGVFATFDYGSHYGSQGIDALKSLLKSVKDGIIEIGNKTYKIVPQK